MICLGVLHIMLASYDMTFIQKVRTYQEGLHTCLHAPCQEADLLSTTRGQVSVPI